jgi:hypothetical protein
MKFGFLPALTLLFIGLKLTHNIDWSWWYVTMPSWFPLSLGIGIWIICKALEGIIWLCMSQAERDRAELVDSLEKYASALRNRK